MRVRLVIASALLLPLGAACDTGAVPRGDGPLATSQCDAGPPAVATAASGKPLTPAALHPSFPREAVDHTVTYASGEPEGGDRMVVSRHGHFVRREVRHIGSKRHSGPDREVSFLNLATGATVDVREGPTGELTGVTFWLGEGSAASVSVTGETETIAGEQCSVWKGQSADNRGRYSACIASDGVVLRETANFGRDDSVTGGRVAIEVQRHAVDPADVLPPRQALDWAHWSASHDPARRSDRPANYEVVLTSAEQEAGTLIYRAAAGWTMIETCSPERRSVRVQGSATDLTYHAKRGGAAQLALWRPPTPPLSFSPEPLTGRPATVLGESCFWLNNVGGTVDYHRTECRTRDNLPLIVTETSWGTPLPPHRATSLSRGHTPLAAVGPPAWLLDWTYWGWPELASRSR